MYASHGYRYLERETSRKEKVGTPGTGHSGPMGERGNREKRKREEETKAGKERKS
jgi:hypothetical protein